MSRRLQRHWGAVRRWAIVLSVAALCVSFAATVFVGPPAGATTVTDEASFRAAFADPNETSIVLTADITLTCGLGGAATRSSATAITVDGGGTHSITQSCPDTANLTAGGGGNVALSGLTLVGGNVGVRGSSLVTLTDSTITGLTDSGAGAVLGVDAGGAALAGSHITSLTGHGVVIGVRAVVDATLTDSTIETLDGDNALGVVGDTVTVDASHLGPITGVSNAVGAESGFDGTVAVSGGSVIDSITATDGTASGAYVAPGVITLTDSTVSRIAATGTASGVYTAGSGISIDGSIIRDVSSSAGNAYGAEAWMLSSVSATDSSVSGVTSTGANLAAGIDGRYTTVKTSTVTGVTNTGTGSAEGIGGAHILTVSDTTVSGTTSGGQAVGIQGSYTSDLSGTTVSSTTAPAATGFFGCCWSTHVVNSTFTGNTGPGVIIEQLGSIVYSDIVGNGSASPVPSPGGQPPAAWGQLSGDPSLILFGTVIAQPVGVFANCAFGSPPTSTSYDLVDDNSCALTGTGDEQGLGLDPLLAGLADNGGPTPTLLPADVSPLVDAIPLPDCTAGFLGIVTDQRGLPRPASAGCDIGSVELQNPARPLTPRFTG
jgi:hypothetical protein